MAAKTAVFQIRLTEEEKRMIQKKAENLGLSMGRYLVMLAIKDKEPEELRYFDRIAYMKERLSEEFGEMNDAYLDQVCDDYYNEIME